MFSRTTSPEIRKARRDLIAAQAKAKPVNPPIRWNPAMVAASAVCTALFLVGVVESLPF